jgi:hypothetical protein
LYLYSLEAAQGGARLARMQAKKIDCIFFEGSHDNVHPLIAAY